MAAAPAIHSETSDPESWSATGDWTLTQSQAIEGLLGTLQGAADSLDASAIGQLDTDGALLLLEAAHRLGVQDQRLRLRQDHARLVDAVRRIEAEAAPEVPAREPGWRLVLAHIGRAVETILLQLRDLVAFFGLVLVALLRTLLNPKRLRLTATVHHMEQSGIDAVPLVVVLSFLVGAVIAFLGATPFCANSAPC
ncbi:MAG: hypothetical protein MUE63_13865 [Xanthomonadales bacterium]|nr:hypothetical protein [Xanthomonadales bacterium]